MTTALITAPPSRDQRRARGKEARRDVPLASHCVARPDGPRDPVGLVLEQAQSRVPELVPIRHGRMLVSPFTYFRGAALPMAADLAGLPTSGLRVQLCGDAHLANFGAFASPERRLVFDLNDFDETLPGPFEWDVKRLAASLVVAARDNEYDAADRRRIVLEAVRSYREAMRRFAGMPMLDVWYTHLDIEAAVHEVGSQLEKARRKKTEKALAKARTRTSMQALGKLTELVDGRRRIVSDPPLIVPIEQLVDQVESEELYAQLRELLGSYRSTLQSDRRHLVEQFTLVQMARKVVGVGSVGTRAWILLLESTDGEPLFLQAKEAQASVLAPYAGRSRYDNQGERVVAGQRLMQAASDIFLGWQRVSGIDDRERDFYVRQLRDWKLSVPIEEVVPSGMLVYAQLCGWTLARAHARSGDRIAIAAYLGRSDAFDLALAEFAEGYADLNELDHAALAAAVADGRASAETGL
ncbi:MAG TPA: DUF2252 domain-containing protein [Nocardioides sp.]|nr:DUF2252 domain-containing protein [Nocardioides sp.]